MSQASNEVWSPAGLVAYLQMDWGSAVVPKFGLDFGHNKPVKD